MERERLENQRREAEESQREIDEFERRNSSVKRKVGYPRLAFHEAMGLSERFRQNANERAKHTKQKTATSMQR